MAEEGLAPDHAHAPGSPARPSPTAGQRLLAAALFALTFFSTTTLGAVWWVGAQTERSTDLPLWLSPETIRVVWSDPAYLLNGLAFSLPLLFILLCHELGHYLVCRKYGLPANPPYFLPAPVALGTLGAFIKIRSPILDKRQLFDVGVGGPIAGFVALLPFLVLGVAKSEPSPLYAAEPPVADALLFRPGSSLVMRMLTELFHGTLEPTEVLNLHPIALAAWVGLLATALNLLPLGQLDGGHIVYASLGGLQRRLALPLWLGLVVAGLLFWRGWLVWSAVILVLGLRHPRVLNESESLDPQRVRLAIVALVIFILSFMPVPISTVWVIG